MVDSVEMVVDIERVVDVEKDVVVEIVDAEGVVDVERVVDVEGDDLVVEAWIFGSRLGNPSSFDRLNWFCESQVQLQFFNDLLSSIYLVKLDRFDLFYHF